MDLDKLPPFVRQAIITCVVSPIGTVLLVYVAAILVAKGFSGMDWGLTRTTALDDLGVTFAGGVAAMVALYITPLTSQYGTGSNGTGDGNNPNQDPPA